ncbi:hypothetical protein ACQPW1_00420 [Nocardia sp. CA-128927]|uniref:hypothetical protein n=1 Tax=Nocardia sp. CA-128927 TaxID=3239975 RepID=UPI003D96C72E
MPELRLYEVEINGVRTTLQLSDADAAERGIFLQGVEDKAAAPANKARTPANKTARTASTRRKAE